MSRLRFLLAGAALALMAPAQVQAQDNERLIFAAGQFLTNFHPLIQVNNTKRATMGYGLLTITAVNYKGLNVCVMCEEVPTLENGLAKIVDRADGTKGMEVTFTLRQGLSWGDGTPVTSADVAFTLAMAQDENIGFSNFTPWTRADEVVAVDDRTFTLKLPEIVPDYAHWDQVIPKHIEEPVYTANPSADAYTRQTTYNLDPTNPGLWNGGYVLAEFELGTRLVWRVNPHWPGPQPDIEEIILSYRDNAAALAQAVLAGEIDVAPIVPGGLEMAQFLEFRKAYPDRFQYFAEPGTIFERIAFQLENPILADVKVRQAFTYGIDRQAITDTLFEGLQPVANTFNSPITPYYSDDVPKYGYDPEKAKALLAEAGWTPGADGICVNAAGDRLSVELATTAGSPAREQIALVIQSQLAEVCAEILPKFVPLQEYNGELARKRQFSGMIMSSINFASAASPSLLVSSKAIPTEENKFVGNNFSAYSSPAMDELVAKIDNELDEEKLREEWKALNTLFAQDLPLLPLYFYANAAIMPKNMVYNRSAFDPDVIFAYDWVLN